MEASDDPLICQFAVGCLFTFPIPHRNKKTNELDICQIWSQHLDSYPPSLHFTSLHSLSRGQVADNWALAGWGKCWDHCAKDCEIELGQAAHYRRCHHHNVVMSLTLDPKYKGGAGAVGHLIRWNQRVEPYLLLWPSNWAGAGDVAGAGEWVDL